MKRKILSACLITICLFAALTGCGKNETDESTSRNASTNDKAAVNVTAPNSTIQTSGAATAAPSVSALQTLPVVTPEPVQTTTPVEVNKSVYILNYHAVNDEVYGNADLFVKPSEFEIQMKYLKENGYTAISFSEMKDVANIKKPVIITFDDGYEDNYTKAYPILKQHGLKATLFLCAEFVDKPGYLTTEEIKSMIDVFDIQSHTLTHPDLLTLSDEGLAKELADSKTKIEQLTGKKVNALAYPFGNYDERVKSFTKKYYEYAVKVGGGTHHTEDGNFDMKRIYVSRTLGVWSFGNKLKD